ncbi:B-lymphocyte antigen CD19 isoform X2 [Microcaecilia unicolor]|uniref:B-lymphocyte antigen CD19 isoform X2 n=1 Tax=Microcaecilia unicolor TaxID=1415580 RepID=A0A6P7YN29_9AMPH|nr:B-lymphocyte antigen CD19 isoform X2 [Microcaecilia unicolor]
MSWALLLLILVSCAMAVVTLDSLHLRSREARESNDILLSCGNKSSSDHFPEVSWRKEDWHLSQELQLMVHAEMWHSFDRRLLLPGHTGASLILRNLTAKDSGIYTFTADNISSTILLNVNGSDEVFATGIPGENAQLPCRGANTTWHKDQEGCVQNINQSSKYSIHNGSLVIMNLTDADNGWYVCHTKKRSLRVFLWLHKNEEGKSCNITSQPGSYVSLHCNESLARNWRNCSLILRKNSSHVLLLTISRTTPERPWGFFLHGSIFLLIPDVTLDDAGIYFCISRGQNYSVNMTVIPHPGWQQILGERYWIILVVTGGSLMFCLCLFLLYLQIRQQIKAKKKYQTDILRSFFKLSANGTLNQYGNASPTNSGEDPNSTDLHFKDNSLKVKDADSVFYENVDRQVTMKDQRTLRVGFFSETSEDEEFYESPDNDKDSQISNDGDCYENTQEEIKEEVADNVSTDGVCYENAVEDIPIFGQGQITTDVMICNHSCQEATRDLDRCSEKSTGSQSYEDMQGETQVSPVTTLKPNSDRSLEDDADSYENMGYGNMDTSIYASPTSSKTLKAEISNTVAQSTQDRNFNKQSPSLIMKCPSFKADRNNCYKDMSVAHTSPNLPRGSTLQRKLASLSTK